MTISTLDPDGYGTVSGVVAGTYRVYELPNTAYENKGTYDEIPKDIVVNSDTADATDTVEEDVANQIHRAGVQVIKQDASTEDGTPTAGMTLSGIEFTITNLSDKAIYYYKDAADEANHTGTLVAPNGTLTITTEGNIARTLSNALPYGRYSIQETKKNK